MNTKLALTVAALVGAVALVVWGMSGVEGQLESPNSPTQPTVDTEQLQGQAVEGVQRIALTSKEDPGRANEVADPETPVPDHRVAYDQLEPDVQALLSDAAKRWGITNIRTRQFEALGATDLTTEWNELMRQELQAHSFIYSEEKKLFEFHLANGNFEEFETDEEMLKAVDDYRETSDWYLILRDISSEEGHRILLVKVKLESHPELKTMIEYQEGFIEWKRTLESRADSLVMTSK